MDSILLTRDVMLSKLDSPHDRIYYSSNEDLDALFSSISVENKKVLSVLGSGEQVFHLYEKNPLLVDTFDINQLAQFYYYLRRWSIIYLNNYYPNVFSNDEIKKIISFVEPSDDLEMRALNYWKSYLLHFSSYFTKYLFFMGTTPKKNKIEDLKKVRDYLKSHSFRFEHMDILKKKLPDKYDFIFLSNIPEYYHSEEEMSSIVSNVSEMLNEGGEVLTTNILNNHVSYYERAAFENDFLRRQIWYKNDIIGNHYKKREKVLTKNS